MLTNANTDGTAGIIDAAEQAVLAAASLAASPGEQTPADAPSPAGPAAAMPDAVQPDLPVQANPAKGPLNLVPQPAPAPGSEPLANPQHELMCEHVTGWGGEGEPMTGTEAYKLIYRTDKDATARVNASRLLARADVRLRCAWMRGQLASSIMLNKRAIRAQLYNLRMGIIEKTKATKDRGIALEAARDVERSLGIDKPEIESVTTAEDGASSETLLRVGRNVEALAASILAGQSVTRTVTINE